MRFYVIICLIIYLKTKMKHKNKKPWLMIGLVVFMTVGAVLITNGASLMGKLQKDRPINKLELAVMLSDSIGVGEDFNDYHGCHPNIGGRWYEGRVCFLLVQGAGSGFPREYNPKSLVTRAEAAAMFSRAYVGEGGELPELPEGAPFSDVADPSTWFYQPVAEIAALDIGDVSGWMNKKFKPANNLSKVQARNWINSLERAL